MIGCFLWEGPVNRGQPIAWDGKRHVQAARLLWETECGPIPPDKIVRHTCGVTTCVRLDHLALGRKGHLPKVDRAEVRRLRGLGFSAADLADRFGVHEATIRRAIRRTAS